MSFPAFFSVASADFGHLLDIAALSLAAMGVFTETIPENSANSSCSRSDLTNKRQFRRKLLGLAKEIRQMKEKTGTGSTLYFKTKDNKYLRVNADPHNPITEVDDSNPELLDWIKQKEAEETKKLEKPLEEAVGKKDELQEFKKLKIYLMKYLGDKEEAASDSATTSDGEIAWQSRDGSASATVSSAVCCPGSRR